MGVGIIVIVALRFPGDVSFEMSPEVELLETFVLVVSGLEDSLLVVSKLKLYSLPIRSVNSFPISILIRTGVAQKFVPNSFFSVVFDSCSSLESSIFVVGRWFVLPLFSLPFSGCTICISSARHTVIFEFLHPDCSGLLGAFRCRHKLKREWLVLFSWMLLQMVLRRQCLVLSVLKWTSYYMPVCTCIFCDSNLEHWFSWPRAFSETQGSYQWN